MEYVLILLAILISSFFREFFYEFSSFLKLESNWIIVAINLLGCFFLGISVSFIAHKSQVNSALIFVACGSFTTFSSSCKDSFDLFYKRKFIQAVCFLLVPLLLGVLGIYLGVYSGNLLFQFIL